MDTKRPPFGEARRREILDAVCEQGDALESDFLEIKLDIDISKALGKAKLAKFILGAGNRLPEVAERHFGGYAVMVVGAAQGRADGVSPGIEILDIRQAVEPYIGHEGPGIELERVRLESGREVLFLIVDPPQQGDPLYLCRKNFQGGKDEAAYNLMDGAIYVRNSGNTAVAKAVQVEALFRRMNVTPSLDLALNVEGLAYTLIHSSEGREKYLTYRADRYRKSMRSQIGRPDPVVNFGLGFPTPPDSRPAAVEGRLDKWRQEAIEGWSETEDKLLGLLGEGLRFRVTNRAESFLKEVTLTITFHGARGVKWRDGADEDEWNDLVGSIDDYRHPFAMPSIVTTDFTPAGYPVQWENKDGALVVTIKRDSLPPEPDWVSDDDDVVLVVDPDVHEPVHVTWMATAANYGTAFRGELTVPSADPVDLAAVGGTEEEGE